MTDAIGALPMIAEGSGSGTMSSEMPCFSTRSRSRESPSTDHFSSSCGEISPLQMWFTPSDDITESTSSLSECCVPHVHGRFALRSRELAAGRRALRKSGFGKRDRAAGGLEKFASIHSYGYRISENAAGRRIDVADIRNDVGIGEPGVARSFCHSGSDPKAFHSRSRAARSSNASM